MLKGPPLIPRDSEWLTKSGLKVNESKTALCLFHKRDTTPISILLNGNLVTSKSTINVLGVIFDCKLNWSEHISMAITKANKALNAVRLIKRFFTSKQLVQIVTSNVYSVLFYNSEIWHLQNLNGRLKQKF